MILIRTGGLPLDAWTSLDTDIPDWAALQNDEQLAAEQLLISFDHAIGLLPDSPLRTAVYNARKQFFQRRKQPSEHFEASIQMEKSLRPLINDLQLWHKTQENKKAAELIFEQNLATNYRSLQTILEFSRGNLQRALLFASHDLLAALPAFAAKPVEQFDKKDRRTAFSLLQYLTRAVFKTSPLGQFTTVQVQALENMSHRSQSNISVDQDGEKLDSKSLITPNVALLPAIYEVLLREPAFFRSLLISLNPCVHSPLSVDSVWLYFDGAREAFQQMNPDPVAELVVNTLLRKRRKMSFPDMIEILENEVDASSEQLQVLIFRLIDIGLLEWQLPEQGLSPGWCGGLYNYLGYLPASPLLSEAAYLLQWLRTAARTLPFQSNSAAQQLQLESLAETRKFLEKHGGEMPPISPEQIFFEDVAQDIAMDLSSGTIEKLTIQLAECWQQQDFHPLPHFRARIFDFAEKILIEGEKLGFLDFAKRFLEYEAPENATLSGALSSPRHRGKVGALLQIFQENGEYKAVVNAMYPGGGKMFARWLFLFPAEVSEKLSIWHHSGSVEMVSFPWQGWSNVNFQPTLSGLSLEVPDARVSHAPAGRSILLGNLAVQKDADGFPQLVEIQSNKPVYFTDLGLEAPETRPPAMQVLWHLGVPLVSSHALLDDGVKAELDGGVLHRRRLEFKSLVLARELWELPSEVCGRIFSKDKPSVARIGLGVAKLRVWGIPKRFFGRFDGQREKPQFYDMGSPISMLLLEKNLRAGSSNFLVNEMLPTPDQWLSDRVGEFVVEFQV